MCPAVARARAARGCRAPVTPPQQWRWFHSHRGRPGGLGVRCISVNVCAWGCVCGGLLAQIHPQAMDRSNDASVGQQRFENMLYAVVTPFRGTDSCGNIIIAHHHHQSAAAAGRPPHLLDAAHVQVLQEARVGHARRCHALGIISRGRSGGGQQRGCCTEQPVRTARVWTG